MEIKFKWKKAYMEMQIFFYLFIFENANFKREEKM